MAIGARPAFANLGFDPDALREKHRQARDERLRPEGNTHCIDVSGTFAHFVDDPCVAPGFTREPLNDPMGVPVIGGGLGGLLAGARVRCRLPMHGARAA